MSTSSTIYNLKKREQFYLDRAYWLIADTEKLLTSTELYRAVVASLTETKHDERAQAWLTSLKEYIESSPGCSWVIIYDTSWDHDVPDWDTFRKVNNT